MDNHPEAGISTCKQLAEEGAISLAHNMNYRPFSWQTFHYLKKYLCKLLSFVLPNKKVSTTLPLTQVPNISFKGMRGDIPFEMNFVTGSFLMTRQEVIRQVGLFDERFFFHADDFDFCCRVKQHNWRIYLCPQFEIIHYARRSIDQLDQKRQLEITNYCHFLFYSKYKGKIRLFFWMNLGIICALLELFLSQVFKLILFKKKSDIEKLEREFAPKEIILAYIRNFFRIISGFSLRTQVS